MMQGGLRAWLLRAREGAPSALFGVAALFAGTVAPAPAGAQDAVALGELRAQSGEVLRRIGQMELAITALTNLTEGIQYEQGNELREIRGLIDELRFQIADLQFAASAAPADAAPPATGEEGGGAESGVLGIVRTPVDSEGNPLPEGESVALVPGAEEAALPAPEPGAAAGTALAEPAPEAPEPEDDLAELLAAIQSGTELEDPGKDFQAAEDNLRDGFLEEAAGEFDAFLAAYPDHDLAGEARFLLGEALFGQGRFDDAAAAYNQLVAEHSGHVMVPEAVLRIGMSMARAGRNDKACRVFEVGRERYPDQPERYLRRLAQEAEKADCS